jgi:pseudaminic acid synthase
MIEIGRRQLGAGMPPLLVCELSGNHNGSLDSALAVVRASADGGAGAIKLQTFTPETLTIDSSRPEFFIHDPGGLWHGRRLFELYREAFTPWEWHEPLFKAAREAGLLCISSAFDISSLEFLLALGVDAIKIASFELVHIPLIEAAAQSNRPLIVSTGMGSRGEIDDAVKTMRAHPGCRFILLKCTSAYPSLEEQSHVSTMVDLRERYGCDVGLSDHTLRPYAAYAATALGAVVIEKHVTMSRASGGVDSAFSIEPAEVKELAEGMDLVWKSLGDVRYDHHDTEAASRRERPSIYVTEDVSRGARFSDTNVRVIRPGGGLPPKNLPQILGRQARCDVSRGTPLTWDLIADRTDIP